MSNEKDKRESPTANWIKDPALNKAQQES